MEYDYMDYAHSIFCPNTGAKIKINDIDGFGFNPNYCEVFKCPHCGEYHIFRFDK